MASMACTDSGSHTPANLLRQEGLESIASTNLEPNFYRSIPTTSYSHSVTGPFPSFSLSSTAPLPGQKPLLSFVLRPSLSRVTRPPLTYARDFSKIVATMPNKNPTNPGKDDAIKALVHIITPPLSRLGTKLIDCPLSFLVGVLDYRLHKYSIICWKTHWLK